MVRYIAYCRKSSEEKERQVLSIDAQVEELKEFAKRERIVITEFVLESKTAKEPGRELFGSLLEKVEQGSVNGIVSWHPDRLARNSVDGGKIIYFLDTGKLLDLKFPTFWFDNTPQGKFMLSIAFGQSKYYVDNLSENVKRGLRHKLKLGIWPHHAPLGYFNDLKDKTIKVDPEKAKIVRKAFERFAQGGVSFTEISCLFHKCGVTRRNGEPLHINQIKYMFTNRFYIGTFTYKGELFKGSHKCFISKELFTRVQKQVQRVEKPRKSGHDFAFSGLARCGECGAAITAETHRKYYKGTDRTADYVYYRCTKKLKPCDQKYIAEKELEEQLRQSLLDVALPATWAKDWFRLLAEDKLKETKLSQKNVEVLEKQIEIVDGKSNILLEGYLDGTIGPEEYKKVKNRLFEEKEDLESQIDEINEKGSNWLEPFEEFIRCAFQARKIASKNQNRKDLKDFAMKVGSNFFLEDKRLRVIYKKGFDSAFFRGGGVRAATDPNDISLRAGPTVLI